MPHISRGVEYGLHCMLYLSQRESGTAPSAQELAEFQGVSRSFVAKLFTKLEKAGLVHSTPGARGGYTLAREPSRIQVLDVVDAIDGRKRLFECTEVRRNCVLFNGSPPPELIGEVCGINRVMIEAEEAMRSVLADRTLADISSSVAAVVPIHVLEESSSWFKDKAALRTQKPRRQKIPENKQ